ncbi:hypothetical protein PTTG_26281 [Puccinia triticina 1-1 BBBD Race 1]|uniref:Uncharacterized protein n=2 Tax=Puccinia triticina TaxID=208348 RepID=A0A180GV38_PUCT1|nr:hypothetical protein PTTG_26281 [Puccinia triticina 1-1 BBBD Race 1]
MEAQEGVAQGVVKVLDQGQVRPGGRSMVAESSSSHPSPSLNLEESSRDSYHSQDAIGQNGAGSSKQTVIIDRPEEENVQFRDAREVSDHLGENVPPGHSSESSSRPVIESGGLRRAGINILSVSLENRRIRIASKAERFKKRISDQKKKIVASIDGKVNEISERNKQIEEERLKLKLPSAE